MTKKENMSFTPKFIEDSTVFERTDERILNELTEHLNGVIEDYKYKNNDEVNDVRSVGYLTCAEDVLRFIYEG